MCAMAGFSPTATKWSKGLAVPRQGVIAEVGVALGTFSEVLIRARGRSSVQMISPPHVFEPDFYRRKHPGLAHLTDQQALEHYRTEGIANGYQGTSGAERGHLL